MPRLIRDIGFALLTIAAVAYRCNAEDVRLPPNPLNGIQAEHHEWSYQVCGGQSEVVWMGFSLYGDLGAHCRDGTEVWLFRNERWTIDKPTQADGLKKVTVYGKDL